MGEFGRTGYEKFEDLDPIETVNVQGSLPAGIELRFDKKQQKLVFVDVSDPSKTGAAIPVLNTIDLKTFTTTGVLPSQTVYLESTIGAGWSLLKFRRVGNALTVTVEKKAHPIKTVGRMPAGDWFVGDVRKTGDYNTIIELMPKKTTGPNTPPKSFPEGKIAFADVDRDGKQQQKQFSIKEGVGVSAKDVYYTLTVRNVQGTLEVSLAKTLPEALKKETTLSVAPERNLYVTKPFTGSLGLSSDKRSLVVKGTDGESLRSINLSTYVELQKPGGKMVSFGNDLVTIDNATYRVSLKNVAGVLEVTVEEYVPVAKDIQWLGDRRKNTLGGRKTTVVENPRWFVCLQHAKTGEFAKDADGHVIELPLTTDDFVRESSTPEGRLVAYEVTFAGTKMNFYVRKEHGVAYVAAESLDVPGDVEIDSFAGVFSKGRLVPATWFISDTLTKEAFAEKHTLPVIVREAGKPDKKINVVFTSDEVLRRPSGAISGGLNYPGAKVSKEVVADGVTYVLTFENRKGIVYGHVENRNVPVEAKEDLVVQVNMEPQETFGTPLIDKELFDGKEIYGFYKKLEPAYVIKDPKHQERFARLTLGRDRLGAITGTRTDFDVYRDDKLDPFSVDHPGQVGLFDDSLVDIDMKQFKDPASGWIKTAEGYKKGIPAEDVWGRYDEDGPWEVTAKLEPRFMEYNEPLPVTDPERVNTGKTTKRVKKQVGYMLRIELNIPPTSRFWQEDKKLGDIMPDLSVFVPNVPDLVPDRLKKRWERAQDRWSSRGDRSEVDSRNNFVDIKETQGLNMLWPVPGGKTVYDRDPFASGQDWGWRDRPTSSGSVFHEAIDINHPNDAKGTADVVAALGGKVVVSQDTDVGGDYTVRIYPSEQVTIGGKKRHIMLKYHHVNKVSVPTGGEVQKGQSIAKISPTLSKDHKTAPHLHFEVVILEKEGKEYPASKRPFTYKRPGSTTEKHTTDTVNPLRFFTKASSGYDPSVTGQVPEGYNDVGAQLNKEQREHMTSVAAFYTDFVNAMEGDASTNKEALSLIQLGDVMGLCGLESAYGSNNVVNSSGFAGWFQVDTNPSKNMYAAIKGGGATNFPRSFIEGFIDKSPYNHLKNPKDPIYLDPQKNTYIALSMLYEKAVNQVKGLYNGNGSSFDKKHDILGKISRLSDYKQGTKNLLIDRGLDTDPKDAMLDELIAKIQANDDNLKERYLLLIHYGGMMGGASGSQKDHSMYHALAALYLSEGPFLKGGSVSASEGNDGGSTGGGGGRSGGSERTPETGGNGVFSAEELDDIIHERVGEDLLRPGRGGPRSINNQEITSYSPALIKGKVFGGNISSGGSRYHMARKGKDLYVVRDATKTVTKIDMSRFEHDDKKHIGRTKSGYAYRIDGKSVTFTYVLKQRGAVKRIYMGAEEF